MSSGATAASSGVSNGPETESSVSGTTDVTLVTVPGLSRRIAPRYEFRVPATLRAGSRVADAMLEDISVSGVRIEKPGLSLGEGEPVHICFSFFENSPPIDLKGEVIRLTPTGGLGIAFQGLDARVRQVLRRLIPKVARTRVGNAVQQSHFSGSFKLKVRPTVHQACTEASRSAGLDLGAWAAQVLERAAQGQLEHVRASDPAGHDLEKCPECQSLRKSAGSS